MSEHKHTCEKCGVGFKQKSHYTQHMKRKNPCITENKLKEYIGKVVEEKISAAAPTAAPTTAPTAAVVDETVLSLPLLPAKKTYTFIEVCAGGGGLSSGLMKAGFSPLLLNDNNKDCCETLKSTHKGVHVVCGSMEKLDLTPYIGKVDLFTGGVPCQSFSQAGLRKGLEDPRGELMLKFVEMLHILKPKIFMIENVKGLITHNSGKTIEEVLKLLNKEDLYQIEYKLLNANDYGVPQKRERVFIIGTLKAAKITFQFPEKDATKLVLHDVLMNVPLSPGSAYGEEKIRLFKLIPQGGCWINLPEAEQRAYLGNSYLSGGGKRGILYRLALNKPSLTLLCTPSQKQTERCHPLEERPLTIREYARIQTFGDDYTFTGSIASQYKQIGNAVPVELAKRMGSALLNALGFIQE
jgi:DNA (cytosine-5)-methyltransferase 1